jgi:mutator protein MutT
VAQGHSDDLSRVVAGVAMRGDRVFMARRPSDGVHGNLWEFPGGKVEPGEDDASALQRELWEELRVRAQVHALLVVGRDPKVSLWCYWCSWRGQAHPTQGQETRWVPLALIEGLKVPPADVAAVQILIGGHGEVS